MSVAQFDDLLTRIGARIARMDTNYRRSIPAEERLSICLRTIASSFRVGISTISSIIPDVVAAIWDGLVEEFMPVPGEEEWRLSAMEFEERWNFPLCCGAIDGKHINLKAPPNSGSLYFNYKGNSSRFCSCLRLHNMFKHGLNYKCSSRGTTGSRGRTSSRGRSRSRERSRGRGRSRGRERSRSRGRSRSRERSRGRGRSSTRLCL
uniref:DDE Tnp4 domain-containing protein n=1 Tax=Knipowitschia caucasica TaxID=637954 RepID=A0AAV2JEE4_KNICA